MRKIAIITTEKLPVPAVKGGAVENLVQFFLENNESEKLAELTVFSCYDNEAVNESAKYKNTEFVFCKSNKKADRLAQFCNRVIVEFLPELKLQFFPYLRNIVRAVNKGKYDYVIVENRPQFVSYISRKCKVPLVLHIHNDSLNPSIYNCDGILKKSSKVVVVSEYIKNRVLDINKNAKNVRVLKNVIDVKNFDDPEGKIRKEYREKYNIKKDEVVFIYTGRFVPEKGVKELVLAFNDLAKKYDNVKLLVVGGAWYSSQAETPYVSEVKQLAESCRDKIVFSGYVDYRYIKNQYLCADVAITPSQWEEPAGLVVVEGMAAQRPLIVSDSGGISEYAGKDCAIGVKRGKNFVRDLTDAMERLVNDENLRVAMGKRGKICSEQFDKTNYLKNLLEIIEG